MKKFVAFVFLVAVALLGSWIVVVASQREVLRIGSAAPSFAFARVRERTTFHPNPRGPTFTASHARPTPPPAGWGTIDRDVFAHHFGAVMTPALFLFYATGKVAGKWLGERKLEVLLEGGHMGDGSACAMSQAATCGAEQPVLRPTGSSVSAQLHNINNVE